MASALSRLARFAVIVLVACHDNSEGAPPAAPLSTTVAPSTPVTPKAQPVEEPGSAVDLSSGGSSSSQPNLAPRDMHPREGSDSCVEMYTACLPDKRGENCTSAQLWLECGETAKHPTQGGLVRCVCP
jgi:hypothetical protein